MSFSFCFELERRLEFPLSVSNTSPFSITVLFTELVFIIVVLLNLLKYFTESSTLDVWREPKFASDSIRVCFFEFIDYT